MASILSTNRRLVFVFGVLIFLMCFVASSMGESARSARKVAAASEFDEEETEALKDWGEDGEWDEEEDEDQDLEDGFEDEEEDEFEDEEDGFEEEDEREMTDYEAEEEDDFDDEGPEWDEALDQIEDGDGPSLDLGELEGLIDKEDLMRKLEEMGLDLDDVHISVDMGEDVMEEDEEEELEEEDEDEEDEEDEEEYENF